MSAEQIEDWKHRFNEMDKDGNGTVTVSELIANAREKFKMKDEERIKAFAERLMSHVDQDNDKKINFEEFRAVMERAAAREKK